MDHLTGRQFIPPVNRIISFFQTHDIKGKYALYRVLSRHWGNRVVRYRINGRRFIVPVDEWCFWLEYGPENYYLDEMLPFCRAINAVNQPFTFFDLGADIGTVCSLVEQHCPLLDRIIAVEPNRESFKLLDVNLNALPVAYVALNCAVSNFCGSARFQASKDSTIDHEGHIDPGSKGDTPVYRLDELVVSENLQLQDFIVLKIDVEGQEVQAIEGACDTISSAAQLLVLLEVHPSVLEDTKTTPEQLFEAMERIRPMHWTVPALADRPIDRSRLFFDQVPRRQYDIIGTAV